MAFKPERHAEPLPERSSLPQLPQYPPDPRTLVFGFGRRYSVSLCHDRPPLIIKYLSPRNCPGVHLAENFLYIVVVTTLATFSILPELDAEGNALPPKVEHLSGAIRSVVPSPSRVSKLADSLSHAMQPSEAVQLQNRPSVPWCRRSTSPGHFVACIYG